MAFRLNLATAVPSSGTRSCTRHPMVGGSPRSAGSPITDNPTEPGAGYVAVVAVSSGPFADLAVTPAVTSIPMQP